MEVMTPREMIDIMDARERERARGVKWVEFAVPLTTPATNHVIGHHPESGFVWSAKIVSVTLASSGTLLVYKVSGGDIGTGPSAASTLRLVGQALTSATTQVITWSSNQCYMPPDQTLYLIASQNINSYYVGAEQAIAEQHWKIFD
jgi:hypothetical protein